MITIIVKQKDYKATFETDEHINLRDLLDIIVCAMQADGWTYVKALQTVETSVVDHGDDL